MSPFGDDAFLATLRNACAEVERLPAGPHQTRISMRLAEAAHGVQQLQRTGEHFWPQPLPDHGAAIHRAMLCRIDALMSALPNTPEARELSALAAACHAYEEEVFPSD